MTNEMILTAIAKAASRYTCEIDTDALTITLANGASVVVGSNPCTIKVVMNGIDQRVDLWCGYIRDKFVETLTTKLNASLDRADKLVPYEGEAIRVCKQVSEDSSYDIDTDLDAAISKMQRDRTYYTREGWTNLKLEYAQGSYSDYDRLFLVGERLETAAETNKRIRREDAVKIARDQRDREEWERLNKRFGSQS
ncbi:MAG: hypothetical protein EOO77_23825 [Oxalobacteraceae bacterium]|nr:MAG: hypothetical protein EOO77_23825 [Oxalobacteraceae bacterium]